LETHGTPRNAEFARRTRRDALLGRFGDSEIVLSSANAYSYDKQTMTLADYVSEMMTPWTLDVRANQRFYHFGDNDHKAWAALFDVYEAMPIDNAADKQSLSFGVGPSGSGVPFHIHGPVWAELFYGAKRWFFYAPGDKPKFDPDASSLSWLRNVYPTLGDGERPLECVARPGDIVWIPDQWYHSTLNIGDTLFLSAFV
jgi:jumonji domain-containing protein 8